MYFWKASGGIWRGETKHQEQGTPEQDTHMAKRYAETVEVGREVINKGLLGWWIIWPSDLMPGQKEVGNTLKISGLNAE